MSLSSISIKRPVLASVMSIVIVLFGIIGLSFLGVREYPSVDPPIVTVTTNYVGANADVIETQITEPLEEAVNGIEGISTVTSVSRDGRSTIRVEFLLSRDLDMAANDVREKVSSALGALPPDIEAPIVSKADADASPIIFLNIKSDQRSMLELTEIADRTFKERLQTIPGVSDIQIWGSKEYSMRLWLKQEKLAAYGLTPLDVQNALQRENIELPTGSIEGNTMELAVRTLGRMETAGQFNDLIIKEEGDQTVRFSDVGHAELGALNMRTVLKRDGIPMVGNAIIPQPGSNQVAIADEFYKRLEMIEKDLPEDIETGIGFDNTQYVRDSISEVQYTIFIAFLLVVFIIFFFLRDWRTTLIPVIVIPIALIGAFFVMYTFGFSINVLTLLGIVLAIGLVVDDAIVVLENIYSKIEQGMEPREAGIRGTAEIFFAVIATTLSLVAVFLPVIFLQGITGRLFQEFGVVLAGAVVISSFVALTLAPMLSSKLLKRRERHNVVYRKSEPFFRWLTNGYKSVLTGFMKRRWLALIILPAVVGMAYGLWKQLPQELAPLEDRSNIRIFATGPEGATFEYMDFYMSRLYQAIVEEVPETRAIISVTSPGFGASTSTNSGFMRVMLNAPDERERSQRQIANDVSNGISDLTMARAAVSQEPTIGGSFRGMPVEFVLQAPKLDDLRDVLPEFRQKAMESGVFAFVDVDLKFNKPELRVSIDRQKARNMGVSTIDVAQTLQLGLSGQRYGYFTMDGKQYQVIGQLERADRDDPLDLQSIYVRNNRGELIQLDNLISVEEGSTPPQIFRYNRYTSATVSAQLAEGKTLGDGISKMEAIAGELLDDRFSTALSGESKDYQESASSLVYAFLLALVLVYLVLSAQFESFRDPLIIMFTVPLAIAGTLLALWYFDQSLNIFSQIGIIMLIGLVTKNGILIVEFANQRKAAGLKKIDAIQDAAVARFRPILMTSFSTILGTLPIALALGAGAESRISMGIAIIGGLIFATFLTLLIIPAMYAFISEKDKDVSGLDTEVAGNDIHPNPTE